MVAPEAVSRLIDLTCRSLLSAKSLHDLRRLQKLKLRPRQTLVRTQRNDPDQSCASLRCPVYGRSNLAAGSSFELRDLGKGCFWIFGWAWRVSLDRDFSPIRPPQRT